VKVIKGEKRCSKDSKSKRSTWDIKLKGVPKKKGGATQPEKKPREKPTFFQSSLRQTPHDLSPSAQGPTDQSVVTQIARKAGVLERKQKRNKRGGPGGPVRENGY